MQAEVYRDHNRRLVGIFIQCQTESPDTRVFGDHRQQAHAFRTGEDLGSAAVDPHGVTVAGSVRAARVFGPLMTDQFMDGVIWRGGGGEGSDACEAMPEVRTAHRRVADPWQAIDAPGVFVRLRANLAVIGRGPSPR